MSLSDIKTIRKLRGTKHYAVDQGMLDKVDIYLRKLKPEQWFFG